MTTNPGRGGRRMRERLDAYLESPDGKRVVRYLALAVLVVLRPWLLRLLALTTVATASATLAVSQATVTAPTAKQPKIERQWLNSAAGIPVERVRVPCLSAGVSEGLPPKGVAHTTEGSWAGAMSVFRRHYAPHFMVGRDGSRVRIVQFCPLGTSAAALANRAGGVETNRWARAQIEIVGYSQRTRWLPDPGVLKAYAALLYELRSAAGIPLRYVPNPTRNATVWRNSAGWFAHAGVPENSHWDVGQLDWPAALAKAAAHAPVVNPGHEPVKPPPVRGPRDVVCAVKKPLKRPLCVRTREPGKLVQSRLEHGWSAITARRLQ